MANNELTASKKIIVIGGGIAGLTATKHLIQNGFNVKLIEAKERLGGRILTETFGNHALEIGAQWIHGEDNNAVFKLASEHDLVVNENSNGCVVGADEAEDHFFTSQGQKINDSLAEETCMLLDKIFHDADKFSREENNSSAYNKENESMGTFAHEEFYKFLRTCDKTDTEMRFMEGIFQWRCLLEKADCGCSSIYEMALHSWGDYLECPGNAYLPLKNGFTRVIDVISEEIPKECVQLNTAVQCIYWQKDAVQQLYDSMSSVPQSVSQQTKVVDVQLSFEKSTNQDSKEAYQDKSDRVITKEVFSNKLPPVVIKTVNNDVIEADHVIVTCSLGYLKKFAPTLFKPLMPFHKMATIQRIGFGTVDKIYLEFEQPFWDKDCAGIQFAWLPGETMVLNCLENKDNEEHASWWKDIQGFDTVEFHPRLLCGWIAGREASVMELTPETTVLEVCHELLQRFTGNTHIPKPVSIKRSKWHNDPYTLGSYSFSKLGSTSADLDCLSQPLPSLQEPRVLFAGEATHATYFSTTHGALLSGEREAQRLIDCYSAK